MVPSGATFASVLEMGGESNQLRVATFMLFHSTVDKKKNFSPKPRQEVALGLIDTKRNAIKFRRP